MPRRVYLFREAQPDDPFENALRSAGFEPRSIQVLDFQPINEEAVHGALARVGSYEALVLTSPRAIQVLRLHADLLERWNGQTVYVVGPRTAGAVAEFGLLPVGSESGHAGELAGAIAGGWQGGRLLFLSGDRRRDELPARLGEQEIPFDEIHCYRTVPRSLAAAELLPEPEWAVFFSPSGIEALPEHLPWTSTRVAAIGPTTASALEQTGIPASAVAAAPDPAMLIKALLEAS